jgi:hypothetical protein
MCFRGGAQKLTNADSWALSSRQLKQAAMSRGWLLTWEKNYLLDPCCGSSGVRRR